MKFQPPCRLPVTDPGAPTEPLLNLLISINFSNGRCCAQNKDQQLEILGNRYRSALPIVGPFNQNTCRNVAYCSDASFISATLIEIGRDRNMVDLLLLGGARRQRKG